MCFSQSRALEIQKFFRSVGPNHGRAYLDSTFKLPFYHGLNAPFYFTRAARERPAQFRSMQLVNDILAVTDTVRFKHTKQLFEPPQIKHI